MSYQFKVIEELKNDYLRQSSAFARQLKNAIEILMNMASEETQFLLELIQNADDEKSNWIRLHLTKEAIIFSNNGNPFQYNPDAKTDSVRSICSVGESTKKESGDYIGFFGIGFKSVFRITDSPKIISGGFRFEFNRIRIDDDYPWHIIPHWLDLIPNNLDHSQTHFILPFKVDFGEEYINNLSNTLDYQFESTVLLFLKNIKEIEIINEITEKSQHFRRTLFDVQENLEEIKDLKSGSSSIWKIFDEKYKVPDEVKQDIYTKDYKRRIIDGKEVFPSKVKVIIAFKVDDSKNLIPDSDCLLYSFLPVMQVKTGFKFLFHGDFILTSSRTDFHRQAKWNLWLLSCIADFLTYNTNGNENKKGIIPFFLEHPIWKYQFYSVLPLDGEVTDKILKYIEQPIIEFCKENPVAISEDTNKPIHIKNSVQASGKIREFISSIDLKKIESNSEVSLISPNIRADKESREQRFLRQFGMKTVEVDKFIDYLGDSNWFRNKKLIWFRDLYSYLYQLIENEKRYNWKPRTEKLKSLKIVRTVSGLCTGEEAFLPFKSERIQIENFVHPKILEEDEEGIVKEFLKEIKVSDPETRAIIERVILPFFNHEENWLQTVNQDTEQKAFNFTNFVKEYLETTEAHLESSFHRKLFSIKVKTKSGRWVRADSTYLPKEYGTDGTVEFIFSNINGINYVSKEYVQRSSTSTKSRKELLKGYRDFFKLIGILEIPRIISLEEKYQAYNHPHASGREDKWHNYRNSQHISGGKEDKLSNSAFLEYLEEILEDKETEKLKRLLSVLSQHWDYYSKFLKSFYHYIPRTRSYYQQVDSYFSYSLRNLKWLPTTKGLLSLNSTVYLATKEIRSLCLDAVPYLDIPQASEINNEFLNFLKVQTKLNLTDLIDALQYFGNENSNYNLKDVKGL